jgi:iron-sulfur cluster assembly protein
MTTLKLTPIVTLTDKAAEFIKGMIAQRPTGHGIMVGVRSAGCSGMAYTIEYADVDTEYSSVEYHHTTHNGVKIIIKKEHSIYLHGAVLDLVKEGLNEGLQFSNPNAKSVCGCGSSVIF